MRVHDRGGTRHDSFEQFVTDLAPSQVKAFFDADDPYASAARLERLVLCTRPVRAALCTAWSRPARSFASGAAGTGPSRANGQRWARGLKR
jgi:hypothetical protein